MNNPELLSLSRIEWQFFCTLTFARVQIPESVRLSMFFALLRKQADNSGVGFKKLLWCLRRERGEIGGRLHYHAVIAGFPGWFVNWETTERTAQIWRKVGGGHSKITVFSSSLDGLDYILKPEGMTGSTASRIAGDYHEMTKFGHSCDVMLSESVVHHLDSRQLSRGVIKERGQLRRGRRDTHLHTTQSGASNTLPALLVTGSAITSETTVNP